MIRRNPTLIHMSDQDVQDVRDMVTKQRSDLQNQQQLMAKIKRLAENPNMSKEDIEMLERLKDVMARSEKAKRLGLEPGTFDDTCKYPHLKFIDKYRQLLNQF